MTTTMQITVFLKVLRVLPARLRRYGQGIAELGCCNALLYHVDRALSRLSGGRCGLYKYHFVAQAIAVESLCGGRGGKIAVRLCRHRADLPAGYPRDGRVLDQRYADGALSLTAFSGNAEGGGERLAGFLWLMFDAYQEDEVRARYILASPQSSWDFDVWVAPRERLGPSFARLWDEANRVLRARAVRWSCSRISAFNGASLRAHARIGTVRLGTATFVCCGRWQWMFATVPPYAHLSRGASSFPRLIFDTSRLPR
jgi:hypothetical protein